MFAHVVAGRMWCHCRMVYLPMSYIYGKRFTGKITELVKALREELFVQKYSEINWDQARNQCAKVHVVSCNYQFLTWSLCSRMLTLHSELGLKWTCLSLRFHALPRVGASSPWPSIDHSCSREYQKMVEFSCCCEHVIEDGWFIDAILIYTYLNIHQA